ncbi:MAG: NADH-quinone oxidoreductase subunit NuoK [Campylobacterota bacterium]|nr:NADH-quinone oxidoreductase subunit NuoK [Campylobacterota bacterium]
MDSEIFNYLSLAMILFSLGVVGVITRRNIIVIYISLELMLNALNLLLVALSKYHSNLDSQVIVLLIIAIAAAEAAVFFAIIVALFRDKKSLDTSVFKQLKQDES